jgi:hypothetical protein
MRVSTALQVTLCLLTTTTLHAGWLIKTGFTAPNAVRVVSDRIIVHWQNQAVELDRDGKLQKTTSYEAGKGARIQLDWYASAREGFIASGVHIEGDGADSYQPVVVRINAAGEVQWARAIDATFLSHMTVAVETANGDVVVVTVRDQSMLMVRFSATGETKWSRIFDRTDIEEIKSVIATRDGGVLVIMTALSRFGALTRFDATGKILWDTVLGTADAGHGFYEAVELEDGGFIAAGRLRTYSNNNREGWLVRVSKQGEVAWQKSIGGDGEDGLFSVVRIGANEYAAVGGTTSAAGDTDTWIVRFTAGGEIRSEIAVGTAGHDGPQDPHRAFAAAIGDGQLVFASPAGLDLLVGKIGAASGTCEATRGVRMAARNATATRMQAELIQQNAAPAIRPVVVVAERAGEEVEVICRWPDDDTAKPAAVQVIQVEAPGEEALFADSVVKLVTGRKFVELDALAATVRDGRATFDSGRSKLRVFYEAVARHTSLVTLGDEAHRVLLEKWRTGTQSETSRIALGSLAAAAAERVRGSGFVNSILEPDADAYSRLVGRSLELLLEAEKAGGCDAACYDLQIRTAHLGGWSQPLRKLLAVDPLYWEAFAPATFYLGQNWGGAPDDIDRFVKSWTPETTGKLTDALYALHFAEWRYGVIYPSQKEPPPPDWARMKRGFADFQRLHPKSRLNAHRFALSAYRVARDRDTARTLFQSPLLVWSTGLPWTDRVEFDRARAWALREPLEPFARKIADASGGALPPDVPRLVAAAEIGTAALVERTNVFLAMTPAGPVGLTAVAGPPLPAEQAGAIRLVIDGDISVAPQDITTTFVWKTFRFAPPDALVRALHPVKIRQTPLETGDLLYVVACAGGERPEKTCRPRVVGGRASNASQFKTEQSVDWTELAGAPVFDDDGAVAGTLVPDQRLPEPTIHPVRP